MQIYFYLLLFQFLLISPAVFDSVCCQSSIGSIPLPAKDFHRMVIKQSSFAQWLRELPLKNPGASVLNYRGDIFKTGTDTSVAFVVNMDIKGRRLEQCMDILVRLYTEYLWDVRELRNLILPLPGGYWLKWMEWKEGFRPVFRGVNVKMMNSAKPDSSYKTYKDYLNIVYSESHTQQFYYAYLPVKRTEVQIGDIIIKKGTKGHAIMIVDLAINEQGEKIALIGNGDTPACQFFLLNHKAESPWIPLNFDQETLDLPLKRKLGWDGLRRFGLPRIE